MDEMWYYVIVGFVAQLIDGTLGMAYGVSASSLLMSRGLSPAMVSSTVHAAECFTTGVSGVSHLYFKNIDKKLFWRLVLPGVIGAMTGAYILANIQGDRFKPYIAVYLLCMGIMILVKAFRSVPPVSSGKYVGSLGFVGALVDAMGGGGWGPIVTSTLIARGGHTRSTIGTVNAVEFFVTMASSVVFIATLGLSNWNIIAGLAIGGMFAAPLGGYLCKHVSRKPCMFFVGLLVIGLSIRTLIKCL